eukprot:873480-Pelagomonas_calceolata.AAC.4
MHTACYHTSPCKKRTTNSELGRSTNQKEYRKNATSGTKGQALTKQGPKKAPGASLALTKASFDKGTTLFTHP